MVTHTPQKPASMVTLSKDSLLPHDMGKKVNA